MLATQETEAEASHVLKAYLGHKVSSRSAWAT